MMKFLGQRDFSAQEKMHHLLSLKLVGEFLRLNPSTEMKNNVQEKEDITYDSLLDTYKYQLLKHKPRHTIPDNAWGDQQGNDNVYINMWRNFLQTEFARKNIPGWLDKTQCIDE